MQPSKARNLEIIQKLINLLNIHNKYIHNFLGTIFNIFQQVLTLEGGVFVVNYVNLQFNQMFNEEHQTVRLSMEDRFRNIIAYAQQYPTARIHFYLEMLIQVCN